jgi:hypothetical protein
MLPNPSVAKNPQQSVTVVAKIVADCAGSKPNHFMTNGIVTPLTHAIVWLITNARKTIDPRMIPWFDQLNATAMTAVVTPITRPLISPTRNSRHRIC